MSNIINLEYNPSDPSSIERYAKYLVGNTFSDVCDQDTVNDVIVVDDDYEQSHEDKKRKGGLGDLIEERYFHYKCNSDSRPDFPEAGVELKVTPYKKNRNGSLSAKERLVITMIDYYKVVDVPFDESHLWNKAKLILLIYYLFQEDASSRLDYRIDFAQLFTPPEEDLLIIKRDYETIVSKIRAGKAHELSESDTLYLGACTKSSDSSVRRGQPFSDEPAKPRAFSFKTSYMTYVLNNYIASGKQTYEPIVKEKGVCDLEMYIKEKIGAYRGYSVSALCEHFGIGESNKAKNLGALLAYRILGIKSNNAEELVKANIVTKTIRINHNNTIKESMSFPTFKFKELIKESWEESTFGNYLRETRFLFIVYKFDASGELHLQGCQFWNIPYEDLETDVRSVWEKTKKVIQDGLQVEIINAEHRSNLPQASDNPVCHVRPHARDSRDTYELPDGRVFPKQCFWLNNTYILSQIDDDLKKDI